MSAAATFLPDDRPADVVGRVRAWVNRGLDPPDPDGAPAAIGKLRLAGVYDDRQDGLFMLRIRIAGGRLGADQAETIAAVAEEHSRRPAGEQGPERFVEITTRQDLQLHWIRFADLPAIWDRLGRAGVTTLEACGDTLRNVTCCPVAGADPGEVVNASPVVARVTSLALAEPELAAFLPRKFKVAVTGCPTDCVVALVNDLAFTPAERDRQLGFNVHAGGGLSDYPRLASSLDLFVQPARVPDVVRAALLFYRERGDFEHKAVNRFRRLVEELGPETVADDIRARLPFAVPTAGEDRSTWRADDHLGIRDDRRPGLLLVGLGVPVGRLTTAELAELARLARTYGDGELRLTHRQNVVLTGIQARLLEDLVEEPLLASLRPEPDPFERAIVACTSAPFCKFGIFDVKTRAHELTEHLRRTVDLPHPERLAGLRIHLSGCKASCGQTHVGHIGLRAAIARDEDGHHEAFDIALGGEPGERRLARWSAAEVPVGRAFETVASIVAAAAAGGGPAAIAAGTRSETA